MNSGSGDRQPAVQKNIGLCEHCVYMRRTENDRGSTFYLCELSARNPKFPKYPRLPVIQCAGYTPKQP